MGTKVSPKLNKIYKERLIEALELMELGRNIKLQNIKRENPNLNAIEIDKKFNEWLSSSTLTNSKD